jgi:hypothetical protein
MSYLHYLEVQNPLFRSGSLLGEDTRRTPATKEQARARARAQARAQALILYDFIRQD